MRIKLQRIHYMPKDLNPGVLYVSEEFDTAAHLCACGCGSKIRTPLGPTDWSFTDTADGPSLYPSVGNWQEACQSHYWISQGEIIWAEKWTPEQIVAGRRYEAERRRAYYDVLDRQRNGLLRRAWCWIKGLFRNS